MSTKKKKIQKEKEDLNEIIADNHFKSVKLNIKNFNLTDKQKSFAQIAFDKNTKIIFINGPAGSSKTFLAVYCALHILNMNPRSELKYIRTIAESGERALGSLPGTVDRVYSTSY